MGAMRRYRGSPIAPMGRSYTNEEVPGRNNISAIAGG